METTGNVFIVHHGLLSLEALQKTPEVVLLSYKVTNDLPKDEQFGLVTQMRHGALSHPAS